MFALHQFLIGLRRRHPWLHRARTEALLLDNRRYLYQSTATGETLLVALNLTDDPMPVRIPDHGYAQARVVAGSGAPPEHTGADAVVPAHGWLILAPL